MTEDKTKAPHSEASTLASQTVLIALLSQLAEMSPQLRIAITQALEAAARGLELTALEERDSMRRITIGNAASAVEKMHDAALGASSRDSELRH
ncbi:hypothetical protein [Chelativorans sp. YIM 93263]|uniref:hypothetical protein n=1 Tax=Chelativorans sp. YIM 93263 TaxID=2906648 RepID=UPI0023796F93|nr:hypothetical protein [Chelativorans sp. YIM 93263]